MTGHSAGPWKACHDGDCQCGFIWAADGETQVASVHGPSALGKDWYGADQVCNSITQKANARLITAAPDMLAALKTAEEAITHLSVRSFSIGGKQLGDILLDVINKAEA